MKKHTSDKIMMTIAIADTLDRAGWCEETVDEVVRALNNHGELVEFLKDIRSSNVLGGMCDLNSGTTLEHKISRLLARAEGKA